MAKPGQHSLHLSSSGFLFDDIYLVPLLVQYTPIKELQAIAIGFDGAPRVRHHQFIEELLEPCFIEAVGAAVMEGARCAALRANTRRSCCVHGPDGAMP